jgi:heat shock protein HslJ
MKKITLIAVVLAVLVAAYFFFNFFIYTEKQGTGEIDRYRATLSGEYVCLPHKNTGGPQTLECAFGLKTDVGEYYALDFNLMSQSPVPPNIPMNTRITASGVVTPIEMLSTDMWQKYPIEGIFSVTDSLATEAGEGVEGAEWVWTQSNLPGGKAVTPAVGKFVLTLDGKGGMTSSTDCNRYGGAYTLDGRSLGFSGLYSTKMYCEGSLEGEYARELALSTSYAVKDDELHITLGREGGLMVFTKK